MSSASSSVCQGAFVERLKIQISDKVCPAAQTFECPMLSVLQLNNRIYVQQTIIRMSSFDFLAAQQSNLCPAAQRSNVQCWLSCSWTIKFMSSCWICECRIFYGKWRYIRISHVERLKYECRQFISTGSTFERRISYVQRLNNRMSNILCRSAESRNLSGSSLVQRSQRSDWGLISVFDM